MSRQRTCCVCGAADVATTMIQISLFRFAVLKQISRTSITQNSYAHVMCLDRIGLRDMPRSKNDKEMYEEKFFWPNIRRIIGTAYSQLHANGELDVDDPTAVLVEHLRKIIPLLNPSNRGIRKFMEIVKLTSQNFHE